MLRTSSWPGPLSAPLQLRDPVDVMATFNLLPRSRSTQGSARKLVYCARSSPRYFARPFTQLDSLKRPQRACHANIGREGVKRLLVDDTPFNLQGTGAAQIGPRALELDPARHLTRYGSVDV